MPTIHELILSEDERAKCACALCEEGRFIKGLRDLLPEVQANDLGDWYNALRDSRETSEMTLHHLQDVLEKAVEYVEDLRK
jgi:hypothetical protein